MNNNLFGVIMAGGRGSRFWPRSRKKNPKQLLNIVGSHTMIQDTVNRLDGVIPLENIYIITNGLLRDEIIRQVPGVPPDQIVAEPVARSTAPCIGLAAAIIHRRCPSAVMAVFAADHLIGDVEQYQKDLLLATDIAGQQHALVTFGIKPLKPDTGFGYIQAGDQIHGNGTSVRKVLRFVEKPDVGRAVQFFHDPDYFINSGMFVWRVDDIIGEIVKYLPEMRKGLERIEKNYGTPFEFKAIGEEFPRFPSISIDYGVLERSGRVAVVMAGFTWSDIGSWDSLYDVWPQDENGNVNIGRKMSYDSHGTLIYSPKKFVAAIGVRDIIIVETEDALLVCGRDHAQKVSEVVEYCRKNKLEEYL